MKTKLLLFFSYVFFTFCYSQDKLTFTYDAAGNQILRDKVCIDCPPPSTPQLSRAGMGADLTENGLNSKPFVVYPNPVSNLLFVEWLNADGSVVEELNLFTLDGKHLLSLKPKSDIKQVDIDFSKYPSGVYLLIANFNSGKNESFKIIKK
ncbi:MAG: T9SS type A sorting domain-containing protein [Flavobacteriaceae bacterium]|nr:T9SS type A sorting domain-containing protein [Flavobacteriaceae bacterium]MDZ4147696.1 T9SS type A sorting domain-containing protein [Flavobacteriaceae bacterium]